MTTMAISPRSLWRKHDFLALWVGSTVSAFGTQVSALAIPILVIERLRVSALAFGLLYAGQRLPPLLFALPIGAWIDRLTLRPVLIAADLLRAALLLAIPFLATMHVIGLPVVVAIGFLVGVLSLAADVTATAILPSLVSRHQLADANSKLGLALSAADLGGPALAGAVVGVLGPTTAVVVDAASYLVSAGLLFSIRSAPRRSETVATRARTWLAVRQGMAFVVRDPILRSLSLAGAVYNFFASMVLAILTLYLVRDVGLDPPRIGIAFCGFGIGTIAAGLIATRAMARFRLGTILLASSAVSALGAVTFALAAGPAPLVVAELLTAMCAFGGGMRIFRSIAVTVRQLMTPPEMLGRAAAVARFISSSTLPLGAMCAAFLSGVTSLHEVISIGSVGTLIVLFIVGLSSLRTLRQDALIVEGG